MSEAALDEDTGASQRVTRQRNQTPEQKIADARKSLEATNAENAHLRTTVQQVTEHATRNGKAASDAELSRIQTEETTLANGLTQARNAETAAKAAKAAARESGNVQAELDADDALMNAKVDVKILTEKQTFFLANKDAAVTDAKALANPPQIKPDTSARDRWFATHPKFQTDPKYKQDALDAHAAALGRKIQQGTPEYFAHLDQHLERIYGANHGGGQNNGNGQGQERDMEHSSSSAAGPSRESTGGAFTHTVDGSTLQLSRDEKGVPRLTGQIPATWRQAASWCGMDEVKYAIDKMLVAEEEKAGTNKLHQTADGMSYRV